MLAARGRPPGFFNLPLPFPLAGVVEGVAKGVADASFSLSLPFGLTLTLSLALSFSFVAAADPAALGFCFNFNFSFSFFFDPRGVAAEAPLLGCSETSSDDPSNAEYSSAVSSTPPQLAACLSLASRLCWVDVVGQCDREAHPPHRETTNSRARPQIHQHQRRHEDDVRPTRGNRPRRLSRACAGQYEARQGHKGCVACIKQTRRNKAACTYAF